MRTYNVGQILSRVQRIPISSSSNKLKMPLVNETSRANGSRYGGILSSWVNEADAFTATKPKFRLMELALEKIVALCYVTDELLADAAALESVLMQAFP